MNSFICPLGGPGDLGGLGWPRGLWMASSGCRWPRDVTSGLVVSQVALRHCGWPGEGGCCGLRGLQMPLGAAGGLGDLQVALGGRGWPRGG
jgi:hypothetical protein